MSPLVHVDAPDDSSDNSSPAARNYPRFPPRSTDHPSIRDSTGSRGVLEGHAVRGGRRV